MSFTFNFDVETPRVNNVDGKKLHNTKADRAANMDSAKPAEPLKEAKEHLPSTDLHLHLVDAISETLTVGNLAPIHFLNETVFEKTASEREDGEEILSRTMEQRSDLISGVYEGGLKVWECTYDLLELLEKKGEAFERKMVLDLGCGAGLLGILALKSGAKLVHFQDYNSTVVEQLTIPNVSLNSQENDEISDDEGSANGKIQVDSACKNSANDEDRLRVVCSPPKSKKRAMDPSQTSLLTRSRFFSGDWITFLALVLKETPSPKYDIILTSETIYNTAYYAALHEALHKLLAPDGLVYLATKSHYFGVGGGLHLFQKFVEQRGVFSVDHLWDGDEGLQRHVVGLHFKK